MKPSEVIETFWGQTRKKAITGFKNKITLLEGEYTLGQGRSVLVHIAN